MSRLPVALTGGAVIEALEGAVALGFGLYVGVEAIMGKPHDRASALGVAVMMIGAGAAMLAIARGLLRRLSWGRSPAVLTQLFALFVAYNLIESKQLRYGAPLAVCALLALVALLSRATTVALFGRSEQEDTGSGPA